MKREFLDLLSPSNALKNKVGVKEIPLKGILFTEATKGIGWATFWHLI